MLEMDIWKYSGKNNQGKEKSTVAALQWLVLGVKSYSPSSTRICLGSESTVAGVPLPLSLSPPSSITILHKNSGTSLPYLKALNTIMTHL